MPTRIFTVDDDIKAGVHVEPCTLRSGEVIPAILIGRTDAPGFLPVEGYKLSDYENRLQVVEVDPAASKLVACPDDATIDEAYALIVFRVTAKKSMYLRGEIESPAKSGIGSTRRQGDTLSYSSEATLKGHGSAQFILRLQKGDVFWAFMKDDEGNLHTEFYTWDGRELLSVSKKRIASL